MRMTATVLVVGLLSATPAVVLAQNSPPGPPPPCTSEASRQFDFWLGDWEVRGGPDGTQLAGHNSITVSDDGCRIREHWRGAGGGTGESLNAWDARYKQWRQFWIGASGNVLRLAGGMRDGSMVMEGELPGKADGVQLQRITWTPSDDGSVSQRWDTSDDDGNTWQTGFLGIYRKQSAEVPATP